MIKSFLSIALILVTSVFVSAQDFSFTCSEPTLSGAVNLVTSFHADIDNNSASQIIFTCDFDTAGYPPTWFFSWCVGLNCLPPWIFQTPDTIAAGAYDTVTVYLTPTDTVTDSASVTMRVYPEGNPGAAQSITFTVQLETSIENIPGQTPLTFDLSPAYPNPFNPVVQLEYTIGRSGWVEAAVFNILGREAAVLFQGQQTAGNYHLQWDGCDINGLQLPSGVYYLQVDFAGQVKTAKVVKLK